MFAQNRTIPFFKPMQVKKIQDPGLLFEKNVFENQ